MSAHSGGSVGRASAATALGILFSRLGGLLREIVFATYFGAGPVFDAFVVAFRIPNTLRQFVAEGAFTVACLPHYQDARDEGTEAEAGFLSDVGLKWTAFLALLTLLLWWVMPLMVRLFAHGFSPGSSTFLLAVDLGRVTSGFVLLVGLYGFFQAVAQARKSFFWPALAPLGMNIAMAASVGVALVLGWPLDKGVRLLSFAVLGGGILQLGLSSIPLWQGVKPVLRRGSDHFWPVLKTALPAAAGTAVWQIQVLVITSLASTLGSGAISVLFFADRLIQLPLALVGTAAGSAALPFLAEADEVRRLSIMDDALGQVWLVIFPAVTGLVLLASPLVAVIYGHGNFSGADVIRVTSVLSLLALGLPASVTARVLVNGFYSRKDTRTPAMIATIVVCTVLLFGYVGSRHYGLQGLVGALVVGSWVQCLLNVVLLFRKKWLRIGSAMRALPRMLLPLGLGAIVVLLLRQQFANPYAQLVLSGLLGSLFMGGALFLLGGNYWQLRIKRLLVRYQP